MIMRFAVARRMRSSSCWNISYFHGHGGRGCGGVRASARAASSRGFTFSTARRCLPARLYNASAFYTAHVIHDQPVARVPNHKPALPCGTRCGTTRLHVTTKRDRQYE